MSQYGSLYIYSAWSMFSFLDVYIYIFMKSRKYLAINFSDSLSVPFSLSSPSRRTTIENMLIYLIVSHRSLGCCLFFFTIFSFCSSDWLISIDLPSNSLILSSVYSNLFLKPFSDLLQLLYFSVSEILFASIL